MAHLCVSHNQALRGGGGGGGGVCRGFVPDIQVCGTHGREDLTNATITSNAEEEEDLKITNYSFLLLFALVHKDVNYVQVMFNKSLYQFFFSV